MLFISIKLFHLCSLGLLFAASLYKNIKISPQKISQADIKKLRIADKISGMAAGFMILSGMGMLLHNTPHSLFRLEQASFWIKISILIIASALIIVSKLFLRKVTKQDGSEELITVPLHIRAILRIDIFSLILMSAIATKMVKG